MIRSLTVLLAFQALGELLSKGLLPSIPGPVFGLVCLLAYFVIRKGVPDDVATTANVLAANLGLLFVPAAVGVVVFWPVISEYGFTIFVTLLISVVCSMAATAWVLNKLADRITK
ncbi:MAG TPA: CidA/LrgA family protein [Limnobacter sp.]|uniref:CidA/LrgA family protein n=1 Tax=Limnobacter sp. TaxID=2003368 RepID=UPI002E303681|nr:CidA/LrgA family protein [Limnobacter sp.]HEX5486739.1 CidA/LrgA family protein [Limnobacter sp.]